MRLSTEAKFLLSELKKDISQSSWDWNADLNFADHLGADTSLIEACINSCSPDPLRVAASQNFKHITKRRLKGLRELVNAGLVSAYWVGLGPGGRTDFGVSRIRHYELIR